jgi:hypothetical protein
MDGRETSFSGQLETEVSFCIHFGERIGGIEAGIVDRLEQRGYSLFIREARGDLGDNGDSDKDQKDPKRTHGNLFGA